MVNHCHRFPTLQQIKHAYIGTFLSPSMASGQANVCEIVVRIVARAVVKQQGSELMTSLNN